MMTIKWMAAIVSVAGMALTTTGANVLEQMKGSTFYKEHPLFSKAPDETKALQTVDRFGPVGIGIELVQPAFAMKVKNVEKGSPAEATGKLKPGQIIETINGQKLKDIDPRIQLGNIITASEAADGKICLMVKETPNAPAQAVVVMIPVLGAYSKTWPLNCPKSDKIVRNMADYLARTGNHGGPGTDLGLLFMLSTGEEKDLEVVRGWIKETVATYQKIENLHTYPWFVGWGGIGLCEYYLRTGDTIILPLIERLTDYLKRTQYNGGWSQKGGVEYNYYSGGQMNAAGLHCVTFLLLAKECGVKVDEYTLQSGLKQFYRFAGHGNTPYGDHLPESGFTDNGKVGGLAFTMAAAASLTPEGENSVYAKARDISAVKGFYSTSWMLHGHTGGGIGEIWRSAAMGLMADKKPAKYREFMDNRMWHYELSRRFDGSFGILGGERYDVEGSWGNAYPLTYTIPRKTLRITGAKSTPFCKTYALPARPWGTAADETFLSLVPAPDKDGKLQDVDGEKLATDASWPVIRRLGDPQVSDAVLLMYCRHPEQGIRETAYGAVHALARDHLVVELLKDKDPRARHSGAMVACQFGAGKNREAAPERLTAEMVKLLLGIINDPAESLWTVRAALVALTPADPQLLAPHVDRLCYWLQQEEWWLKSAAVGAVASVAADERYYKQVLPTIGRLVAANRIMSLASQWGTLGKLKDRLKTATPQVQAYAVQSLGQAYSEFPLTLAAPGGLDMNSAGEILIQEQAGILSGIPGGLDELYKRSHIRYPSLALPHQKIFLAADADSLGAELQEKIRKITVERVIPEFVGTGTQALSNRRMLLEESKSAVPFTGNLYVGRPRTEDLVALYNKIGVRKYDWHDFGLDPNQMAWDYFSFDPQETKLPGTGARYRKVTTPEGMTNWFAVDFDAKKAGWKQGLQPFGQVNGALDTASGRCKEPDGFCRCGFPMQTLWEKEVLLTRGVFTFPKFREGYRYRLLVGGMSHVGAGEGFRIYVNSKQMFERPMGVGKREGGVPVCFYIDKSWWPAFDKPVTLAATSFLQVENGGKTKNRFLVWIQEMKAPPVEQLIRESVTAVPMTSAAWQALQNNPDTPELAPGEGKFQYDGTFKANPDVLGQWKAVAQVDTLDAFNPTDKKQAPKTFPFKEITFKENGATENLLWTWSGDVLMNLEANEALKMTLKNVEGETYLFVEAGGFSEKKPFGWKSPLIVLKRVK